MLLLWGYCELFGLRSGEDARHNTAVMEGRARRSRVRRGSERDGRPDWLGDFRGWVSGLSPSAIADLIDELARELDTRRLGGRRALAEAADRVRAHQGTRIRQLVDDFLMARASAPGHDAAGADAAACRRPRSGLR